MTGLSGIRGMSIKARSRPETSSPAGGTAPNHVSVRNAVPPPWQGHIHEPRCYQCSWSYLDGEPTVKYINRLCPVHGRLLP